MVLRYWGERGIDAQSFASLLDRSRAGIQTSVLAADLARRGWNAKAVEGGDAVLRRELADGRPVIALIQDRPRRYHYVVVVAASDRAIVFHDPARAPLRVMTTADFAARWKTTGDWMMVVTPGAQTPNPKPQIPNPNVATPNAESMKPRVAASASPSSVCDALVAEGIARAQANDVDAAERVLTSALGCPGVAALRELAGVRVLQKRWADAASLAAAAAQQDPDDAYLWRLLGTARFVLDDHLGALRAWNVIGEPRVDLVRVDGLIRTRERVVERLIGVRKNDMLRPDVLVLAQRRLAQLPAAFSSRVDFTPVPSGLAELHVVVAERAVLPSGPWAFAGLAVSAAAERDVRVATGSLTGGGESVVADWRFWPDRPRLGVAFTAPAPWGGVWSTQASTETQPFSIDGAQVPRGAAPDSERRTTVRLVASGWVAPIIRVGVRGGLERWTLPSRGAYGTAGAFVALASRDDRGDVRLDGDLWTGQGRSFATTAVAAGWKSSTAHVGHVWLTRAGAGFAAADTPLGAWPAGDTGHARDVLLRAHPVLADNGLRVERLGRSLFHASGEAQQWWTRSVLHVGAAAFVDAARTARRLDGTAVSDVDVGIGARFAAPLLPGVIRVDVAKGLRDGSTAWSVVYTP